MRMAHERERTSDFKNQFQQPQQLFTFTFTAMISFRMSSPLRQIVHNRTQSQTRQAYHKSGWVRGARLGAFMMPLQVVTGVIGLL